MLFFRTWTLFNGYSSIKDEFPLRATKKNYLEFRLFIKNEDITNVCPKRVKNYIIIFHLPNEMPTYNHGDNYIEIGKEKTINLNPKKFTTHESLKKYHPKIRKCYYESEEIYF